MHQLGKGFCQSTGCNTSCTTSACPLLCAATQAPYFLLVRQPASTLEYYDQGWFMVPHPSTHSLRHTITYDLQTRANRVRGSKPEHRHWTTWSSVPPGLLWCPVVEGAGLQLDSRTLSNRAHNQALPVPLARRSASNNCLPVLCTVC
jgi:hypothetical protein